MFNFDGAIDTLLINEIAILKIPFLINIFMIISKFAMN